MVVLNVLHTVVKVYFDTLVHGKHIGICPAMVHSLIVNLPFHYLCHPFNPLRIYIA